MWSLIWSTSVCMFSMQTVCMQRVCASFASMRFSQSTWTVLLLTFTSSSIDRMQGAFSFCVIEIDLLERLDWSCCLLFITGFVSIILVLHIFYIKKQRDNSREHVRVDGIQWCTACCAVLYSTVHGSMTTATPACIEKIGMGLNLCILPPPFNYYKKESLK